VSKGLDRLGDIRLVAFDIDGVFTDGRFYLSDDGSETKAFHTQDGYGVRRLLDAGVEVAVISGRSSPAVEHRMAELKVRHVVLGCKNKVAAFDELIGALGIDAADCAFVGDDIPDLALLEHVGLSIAVANAVQTVQERCDYVTLRPGGFGAVREVCDLVAASRSDQAE
jgi:3-deoxy-D-manno-octulosonate 8-phosphate phosphatase (KDO 8-P phosphatase)